jgi:ankyrin repeat protein
MKYAVTLLLTAALLPGAESPADAVYDAIRRNDLAKIKAVIAESGTDIRDRRGNTPLMLAAGFGTVEAMRILVNAKADVNAANNTGTTALIWGAHDLRKMSLLVSKGANVNAVTKQGRTALMVAAMSGNALPLVEYLLGHGADPNPPPPAEEAGEARARRPPSLALLEAIVSNETEAALLLLAKTNPGVIRSPLGGIALTFAAGNGNLAVVKGLLAAGVDVNFTTPPVLGPGVKNGNIEIGSLTALISAAAYAGPAVIESLLAAGANPNARDVRGMTPLMLAVASDRPHVKTIQLLLAKGADPALKDKYGDDARVWAARYQNRPVMDALKLEARVPAKVALVAASTRDARSAAERGLAILQRTTSSFFREGGCPSCHSLNMTGMTAAIAAKAGIAMNEAVHRTDATTTLNAMRQYDVLLPQGLQAPGHPDLEQYAMLHMKAGGIEPNITTDTILLNELRQQGADGSWSGFGGAIARAPVEDGDFHRTAMGIRVLNEYGIPALRTEIRERISRAATWLAAQEPISTDDRNMQILGLVWADAGATVAKRVKELVALQRADGGWAQTKWLDSDAYATGQSLVALHAAGTSPQDAVYRRGIQFLLRTQKLDGSWHVRSRSPKFQPFFESGFPHGGDQWISSMATGWAVMALAHAVTPGARAD